MEVGWRGLFLHPSATAVLAAGVPAALGANLGGEAVRTAVALAADVDLRRIHRA